jgi:DNA-binding transcriptional LysR family regulator
MAIDKLRYFAAVVETRSIRKAAEIVGITAGSMSKAIATLEAELGVQLLRPEGRGIEITDLGHQVYRSSAHILTEYRLFLEGIRYQSRHEIKRLRLGTFEVFSSYLLSAFLTQEYPQHGALLLELTPGKMESALIDKMIDYGLTYLPSPDPRLEFTEIGSFEMAIWGSEKWIKRPFKEWPFAVPTTSVQIHSSDHNSLDMWPNQKMQRSVKYEFELLETALQTSRTGHSVLYCPDFIIKLQNQCVLKELRLERLPFPTPMKAIKAVKIYLVSRKGTATKPLEGKFAKFFRSLK